MSPTLSVLSLLLSIATNASASLVLKLAVGASGTRRLMVVAACACLYGLALVSYYVCLQRFQVSVAYPVITGGVILTIVLLSPLAGEPLTVPKMIGVMFVILGGGLLLRGS